MSRYRQFVKVVATWILVRRIEYAELCAVAEARQIVQSAHDRRRFRIKARWLRRRLYRAG